MQKLNIIENLVPVFHVPYEPLHFAHRLQATSFNKSNDTGNMVLEIGSGPCAMSFQPHF